METEKVGKQGDNGDTSGRETVETKDLGKQETLETVEAEEVGKQRDRGY